MALAAIAVAAQAAQVSQYDLEARARKKAEFAAYLRRLGPDATKAYLRECARMAALRARVVAREAAGQNTACAHQIYSEAAWISGSVMDPARLAKRLDDLEWVLAHPEEEPKAEQQDPADGSWGACHEAWFFKVDATIDHLNKPSSAGQIPKYRLRLLDRVNSPEKLRDYFEGLAVSDLAATGVDHRRELNESLANLSRLITRKKLSNYAWQPGVQEALMSLVMEKLRNPETAWWGERYVRDGKTEFVNDLSITFHLVSYLRDSMTNLGPVAAHLLAVKKLDYPIGWMEEGRYTNHNNMDVVTLFGIAWAAMDDAQKREASEEIRRMLEWCLQDSLQPDGSFKAVQGSSDSLEENNGWGIAFLERIGYFDRARRFWTGEEFPEAEAVRRRIIGFLEKHAGTGGVGGAYYESDLARLRAIGEKER